MEDRINYDPPLPFWVTWGSPYSLPCGGEKLSVFTRLYFSPSSYQLLLGEDASHLITAI